MGVKRLVPGRSLPYDQLLARYQKREQAKIHKAALKAALEAKAPRHRTLEKGSEEMGDWEII